ncbi:NepR family anti-sigma factor [Sinorhizobium sp. 8-89]|nr:NepR family anti-sigma factor [Sinorhizobium sp. 7-81]MDK1384445.1 NepR family anti-sigma factor [Sinorhizobium sp. 7-81]
MTDPSAQIASGLKALYQALENEPVPQQFIELLERLDAAEVAQSRE